MLSTFFPLHIHRSSDLQWYPKHWKFHIFLNDLVTTLKFSCQIFWKLNISAQNISNYKITLCQEKRNLFILILKCILYIFEKSNCYFVPKKFWNIFLCLRTTNWAILCKNLRWKFNFEFPKKKKKNSPNSKCK